MDNERGSDGSEYGKKAAKVFSDGKLSMTDIPSRGDSGVGLVEANVEDASWADMRKQVSSSRASRISFSTALFAAEDFSRDMVGRPASRAVRFLPARRSDGSESLCTEIP